MLLCVFLDELSQEKDIWEFSSRLVEALHAFLLLENLKFGPKN